MGMGEWSSSEVLIHLFKILEFKVLGWTWALSPECKTDQAHFTDWMSFLQSNLMEEIGPNPELLTTNT